MFKRKRVFSTLIFCLFSSIIFSEISESQKALLLDLPPDQRDAIEEKIKKTQEIQISIDEAFEQQNTLIKRPELKSVDGLEQCEECIYGYNFFQYSPSTFSPSSSMPISSSYVLGPGDKLEISYFGSYQEKSIGFISNEGVLILPLLGPVNLLGMTFSDAVNLIKEKIKSELVGAEVAINLTDLRSISIYLLGQAYKPGNYTLSGLTTLTNALFVSGGVNKLGSLRNIEVRRGGKVIKVYDFYEFLLKGKADSDIRLQDGDVVFVPFIQSRVKVGNGFKAPDLYEIKEGETVRDLIKLAGGFSSGVGLTEKLEYSSINKLTNQQVLSYLPQNSKDLDQTLKDGDIVNIAKNLSLLVSGSVELAGHVNKPGEYSILKGDTILDIIDRAGGYSDNSFPEGAVFLRKDVAKLQKEAFKRSADLLENFLVTIIAKGSPQNPLSEGALGPITQLIARLKNEVPPGRQVVEIDYLKLKTDPMINFRVQKGDFLYIPERPESIVVIGEVLNPATQRYSPNLSVKDYLELSGGLKDGADKDKIYVVLPNGQATLYSRSLFFKETSLVLPGSIIVVERDIRTGVELAAVVAPILATFATSAAALAVLSQN
jgi:protein involved in polysaccharide export with SLBB domain